MYAFIKNPSELKAKNSYAKKLDEKWDGVVMISFDLTDAQIELIMNYCEQYVNRAVVQKAVP